MESETQSVLGDRELVESWLFEQYNRMGFLDWQTSLLIAWGVDYRKAEELMTRGCKQEHALTILKPL